MRFVQITEFDWLSWQLKSSVSNISRISLSKGIREINMVHFIQVHDILLYMNYVLLLLLLLLSMWFYCYGNLEFAYNYNGKGGKIVIYFCDTLYYFENVSTEFFLKYQGNSTSTNNMNFVQITDFNWFPSLQKG